MYALPYNRTKLRKKLQPPSLGLKIFQPLIINILPELPALGCQAPSEHSAEESLIDYEDVHKVLIEHIGSALLIKGSIKLPLALSAF